MKMIRSLVARNFLLLACLLTGQAGYSGSAFTAPVFSLANTLQSNMVIQQGKPCMLRGYGPVGSIIRVKADWMDKALIAPIKADGSWFTKIPVPMAVPGDYKAHHIQLVCGASTITLSNVLIGEVWVCGGQSNMDMELKPFLPWLKGPLNYDLEIATANYPAIRLYNVRTDFKARPEDDCINGAWTVCSPQTVPNFSAAAYFFARTIHQQLRVPVGLVVSSLGATSCQAWTSRDTLNADTVLYRKYLFPYDTSAASKQAPDTVVTFEKNVLPTLLYNAMIYPLRHLSVRGFLWYQGESNKNDGALYTRVFAAMIRNWRKLFAQGDLPFYYVQVAPFKWEGDDSSATYYAYLREAQDRTRLAVPNTGMAVITDICDPTDLHPRNKQGVGWRLARHALALDYGKKDIAYLGPEYARMRVDTGTVKIQFNPASLAGGLGTNDGAAPQCFYIAGADRVFHQAVARIVEQEVWLHCEQVPRPVAVRYAFSNYPVTNLENKAGLPALPFRTDDW